VVSFQSGPEAVATLDRALTLADDVVRHKIVRLGE
jgi:ribosomal protein S6